MGREKYVADSATRTPPEKSAINFADAIWVMRRVSAGAIMRTVERFARGGNVVSSGMIRLSGLAAMLGGVLGIVLTPFLTYLWATYSDAYLYYGRAYFPVYLGCSARWRLASPTDEPTYCLHWLFGC